MVRATPRWIMALVLVASIVPLLHHLGYRVAIYRVPSSSSSSTSTTTSSSKSSSNKSPSKSPITPTTPLTPISTSVSFKNSGPINHTEKGYPFGVLRPPFLAEWSKGMLKASTRMKWGPDYNKDAEDSISERIEEGNHPRWGERPQPLQDHESAKDLANAKLPGNDQERNCKNWGLYGEWNDDVPTRKLFYGTMVNDEVDLLSFHLDEIAPAVDVIVITEGHTSFRGHKKPYHVEENFDRFRPLKQFTEKIRLVHWTNPCTQCSAWNREHATRNFVKEGMSDVGDDDIVILADTDEVPSRDFLNALKRCELFPKGRPKKWTLDLCQRYGMKLWRYWYYFDCTGGAFHYHGDFTHGFCAKNWTMQELRMGSAAGHGTKRMKNVKRQSTPMYVGWHVHNFLPPLMLINKHRSYAEHGVMPQDDRRVDQMREDCDMPPLRPIDYQNEKGEWKIRERLWMHNSSRTRLPRAFDEHPELYETYQHFYPVA